eukprot:m.68974 g.68974  ORF g.68974 m.68974 type:complete len:63 (+) comp9945_c1_seq1:43-231(+)
MLFNSSFQFSVIMLLPAHRLCKSVPTSVSIFHQFLPLNEQPHSSGVWSWRVVEKRRTPVAHA